MNKSFRRAVCAMLSAAMLIGVCACGEKTTNGLSGHTTDLMANVKPSANALSFKKESGLEQTFEVEYRRFAFRLFSLCTKRDSSKENTLVSPLSVMTALAMTANGAQDNTLTEMLDAMNGKKGLDLSQLNQYLGAYISRLPSEKKARFASANSIWVKNGAIDVRKEFLQTNADYYGADVFQSKFDEKTLGDINQWVSDNTDKMLPKILDEISDSAVLYLINALSFDAEWKRIYSEDDVWDGEFTDIDGEIQTVTMMGSTENGYLHDGKAKGFIKPYAAGYSFVAMLPDEGVSLDEYIEKMPSSGLFEQIRKADREPVMARIPKFNAKYSTELNDVLKAMGMNDPFDPENADFSGMAAVNKGELYINRVIHKTAIQVDERGTKAGAATAIEMKTNGALLNAVILDRPFVYMIIDDQSCLPIFIGQVNHIE